MSLLTAEVRVLVPARSPADLLTPSTSVSRMAVRTSNVVLPCGVEVDVFREAFAWDQAPRYLLRVPFQMSDMLTVIERQRAEDTWGAECL